MNKKTHTIVTIIMGLAMVISGMAQSPAKPKRQTTSSVEASTSAKKPVSKLVAALDRNKDGKLSKKEVEAIADVFKLLDKDKNGELTLTEFGLPPSNPQSASAVTKPSRAGGGPNKVRKTPGKPGGKRAVSTAAKPKRPGGRPIRPSGTARPVKKAGASPNTPARPSRVARSGSRTKKAGAVRRKPATTGKPSAAKKLARPVDKELREVIEQVNKLSKEANQAKGKIKNRKNKRLVTNWLNQKYKPLVDSLSSKLGGSDAAKQKAIDQGKKEIEKISKLLN